MLIQKEQSHQYLIIAQTPEMDEFALRMILENHIQGLVAVRQRMFNGEMNLYYDITGKTPLSDHSIRLGGTDMRSLLQSLFLVTEKLSSYFLPEDFICFAPDLVFSQNGEWSFCYIPEEKGDLRESCIRFSEELLGKIDQEDEQAVVLAYQFYRMIKRENDTLHHVILELLYGAESERAVEGIMEADRSEEDIPEKSLMQQQFSQDRSNQMGDVLSDLSNLSAAKKDGGCEDSDRKEKGVDLFALLLFVLLFCGSIGVSCYLIFAWQVDSFWDFIALREGILSVVFLLLSIGGIAVTTLPVVLHRFFQMRWQRKERKEKRETDEKEGEQEMRDVFEIPQIELK